MFRFHPYTVLEVSRLLLVGVADQVGRLDRRDRNRLPLAARGKRGASAADQLRLEHLMDHLVRTDLAWLLQRREHSLLATAVDDLQADHPQPPEQSPYPPGAQDRQ